MKENRKKIIITGATGFIGKVLVESLIDHYEIIVFSRDIEKAKKIFYDNIVIVYWDGTSSEQIIKYLDKSFGVINLAGENIGNRRWTKKQRKHIINSRVGIGAALSSAILKTNNKPEVLIQASAIGYYGYKGENIPDEMTAVYPVGFLAQVTRQWEESTNKINSGIRYVILRMGIVLGKDGGILKRILLPFRLFLGGYPGNGKQWISWIHIKDVVNAILFILEDKHLSGIYNLTSPNPVQYKYLAKSIGKTIKKPSWISIPKIFLILFFGQRAKELLFGSIWVYPKRLITDGYKFSYETIDKALKEIL
jgi:uncharacterized protein (TIGR01777 family)